jgi:putative ABC transport system ATP-binding protein
MIHIEDLTKVFTMGENEVRALDGVTFDIADGESVAIMGPSGSGKSTLMSIIGCLDVPTSGQYLLDGEEVENLSDAKLADIRGRKIGFVFQQFNLLNRTSALENVELPLSYIGISQKEIRERAEHALEIVGLKERMKHHPGELSGGQQQRVAIARALVNRPPLLLADEPTGNLDTRTTEEVLDLLGALNREQGLTIVVVTHEADVAARGKRLVRLKDGVVVYDGAPMRERA